MKYIKKGASKITKQTTNIIPAKSIKPEDITVTEQLFHTLHNFDNQINKLLNYLK